jgi:hypothetical protein
MRYVANNLGTWGGHRVRDYSLPVIPSTNDFLRVNPTAPYYLQIFLSFVVPCCPVFFRPLNPLPHHRTFVVPIIIPAGSGTSFVCPLLRACRTTKLTRTSFRIFPFLGILVLRYVSTTLDASMHSITHILILGIVSNMHGKRPSLLIDIC